MFKRIVPAIACALLLASLAMGAEKSASAAGAKGGKAVPIQDVRLKNGLRVILSEDHSAPVYAIAVTYNVGSRNEVKGRTGFAHLFEHMMYEGSANVAKGEHMLLVQENGGTMNGTTNQDRTLYFESLPANQLDLGLFLEADRMKSLAVTQANLDNQRHAVQEERRLRVDNQPYGTTFEKLGDVVFDNFAYKHSTIGSMADLNAATVEDVAQFFKTYYAPNNATLAVVGDFDSKAALAKIEKYFGSIPSQPAPAKVDYSEPKQTAERRTTIEDQFAPLPRLTIAYKTIRDNTPDGYALDVLFGILGGGQSSRLYQDMVKDKQLVVQINSQQNGMRDEGMAIVMATPRPGKKLEEVETGVYAEIERLKNEGPTDAEMAKVMAQIRSRRVQMIQTSLTRAQLLSELATFYNDPNLINTELQKYASVTKADVQRVAKQYLTNENRSVITTLPKPKSAPAMQAGQ